MIRHPRMGTTVKRCVDQLPAISLASSIQPITRTVLRVRLTIKPEFQWDDRVHGSTSEPWWIWVEDPDNNHIYHSEYFLLHKKQVRTTHRNKFVPVYQQVFISKDGATMKRGLCPMEQRWHGGHVHDNIEGGLYHYRNRFIKP